MKQHRTFIPIVLLLFVLSACAGTQPAPMTYSPTSSEVRTALAQSSPERKVSALKELREAAWPPERRIDVQTLITLQSLEVVPRYGTERKLFQEEAGNLAAMVENMPLHRIPEDTAVLLYLAGQWHKQLLSAQVMGGVDRFCASGKTLAGDSEESLSAQALQAANSDLAASCRYFVDGDLEASEIALANALNYRLATRTAIIPSGIKPSPQGGWDIFKARLQQETGIKLDASASRLMQ